MFPGREAPDLTIVETFPEAVLDAPTQWIEMADGIRLAARIWRPRSSDLTPVPAILETIPYRRRDGRLADDEQSHPYFAGHGYACVRLDIRGSGDSEGLLEDEYLPLEQDDAIAVIEWIAAQPWCSGAVGLVGLSWGGFAALQVAARAPAALKAVIAVGATVDRYNDDVHYKNGCLLNENFGWASSFLSFSTRPPDPDVVGSRWRGIWHERLNRLRFFAEPWFEHQSRDDYWRHGSVAEDYAAIEVPVMIVAGWADLYVNAVPRLLENLSVPVRAIVGPWAHQFPHLATPGPGLDFLGEARRWWDRWLAGEENGVEEDPVYLGFLGESGRGGPSASEIPGEWMEAGAWPPASGTRSLWYLREGGLKPLPGPAPETQFRTPPCAGTERGELIPHCSGPEMARDQRLDDGASLLFDSRPLEEPLSIWGDPILQITVSSDSPTGHLVVRLCDVGPDGVSRFVTWGLLNLCHRDGNDRARPVTPGEAMTLHVPLDHVAHRFRTGHRLRLALSTASWPNVWPAADDPTFTLATEEAVLALPRIEPGEDPRFVTPPPPCAPPATPAEERRAPSSQRSVTHDQAAGESRFEIVDDYGKLMLGRYGIAIGGLKRETYRLSPEDTTSATASFHWTQELERDGWRIRTETETQLTCSRTHFHLHAKVQAFEQDRRVFEKEWSRSIRREPFTAEE